jgi:hypothetical protein
MVEIETRPVLLSQKEEEQLASIACREKFNIGVEKIAANAQNRSGPDDIYAEVLCQSHSKYNDNPMHHVVYCDKDKVTWRCYRSEQAIRLIAIKSALVYFDNDIDAATILSIAQMLVSSKFYQGEELPDLRASTCSIRRYSSFDNVRMPDVLVTTCAGREIFISTWCPQKECPRIIATRVMI